jgi:hypothetical protein
MNNNSISTDKKDRIVSESQSNTNNNRTAFFESVPVSEEDEVVSNLNKISIEKNDSLPSIQVSDDTDIQKEKTEHIHRQQQYVKNQNRGNQYFPQQIFNSNIQGGLYNTNHLQENQQQIYSIPQQYRNYKPIKANNINSNYIRSECINNFI